MVAVRKVSCVCVRDLSCWLQSGRCHVSVEGTFPVGCSPERCHVSVQGTFPVGCSAEGVTCLCKGPSMLIAVRKVSRVCVRDLSCWLQCGRCHVSV